MHLPWPRFFSQAAFSSFLLLVFLVLITGCSKGVPEEKVLLNTDKVLHPVELEQGQLQPGLSVLYFNQFYRHISQMPKGEKIAKQGKKGPPILYLDHVFAKDVNVFDSNDSRGVGMFMSGYLHLAHPGAYIFQAKTNDGFELFIGDMLILSDPGVHGDRLSDQTRLTVSRGGWFPVSIKYFQRKGTAALTLYWQPDGASELTVVPEDVYAHIPQ